MSKRNIELELNICEDYKNGARTMQLVNKYNKSKRTILNILIRHNLNKTRDDISSDFIKNKEKLKPLIIEDYLNGILIKDIVKKYNISKDMARIILQESGHSYQMLTDDEKINIINEYNNLVENGEQEQYLSILPIKFNRSIGTIMELLRSRKVRKMNPVKKYTCNENYFENIDTPDKAYWLGFIAADGNISRSNLHIGIHKMDVDHLEKFKKDINATNPVKIKKYISKEKHSYIARIDLYSKKIVDDLKHHGLYPNKTHTLSWDNITKNIPDNFIIDFVRGFFDGDGSWKVSKNRITFNVSSVSKDFIEPFSEWFSKMINVKSYKIYKSNHITSTMYSYERAKKEDLIKIYKVLYNGEVCLDRKYLRAKSFIIT